MIDLQTILIGLEEVENTSCELYTYKRTCNMDCDYYISGCYGSECALDIVQNTLGRQYNASKST